MRMVTEHIWAVWRQVRFLSTRIKFGEIHNSTHLLTFKKLIHGYISKSNDEEQEKLIVRCRVILCEIFPEAELPHPHSRAASSFCLVVYDTGPKIIHSEDWP